MEAAIIVAIIALIGAMLSAGFALYGQLHMARREEEQQAAQVLAKYREPLILAAYDLQSRLYNILRQNFLGKYYATDRDGSRQYAVDHTLYLIGQYLAWTEILRREVQFLQFSEDASTRRVSTLLFDVRDAFASDRPELGPRFMIWRGEQNAIGERMITVEDGQRFCIGYATFVEKSDEPGFRRWFERLASDIGVVAGEPNLRLRKLQHRLVDLVTTLDEGGVRFQKAIDKA
ncbi:MAG TPA: hypothetical protein VLA87_12160 [Gaiellaceae bacterium]|nr:hypothetical protein [Gaiellaceae bacterium]